MKVKQGVKTPRAVANEIARLYLEERWGADRIEVHLKVSKRTVYNVLKEKRIKTRTKSEAARLSR